MNTRGSRRDAGRNKYSSSKNARKTLENKRGEIILKKMSRQSAQNTMESNFLYLKIKHRSFFLRVLFRCLLLPFQASSIYFPFVLALLPSRPSFSVCRARSNESDFFFLMKSLQAVCEQKCGTKNNWKC